MDDIGAVTERRGYILFQAKHHLTLSKVADSPLADALDQAVRQFIEGAPNDADGTRRPLEPGRDALVICTDSAASAPIRESLSTVVVRLASHPQEIPLAQVAKNEPERKALKVLLDHLRAAFACRTGGMPPSEEQLREISQVLHLIVLDLDSGGSDRLNAETHLQTVLADAGMATGAWNDLATLGQELIEGQRWANHDTVRHSLASGGHPAGVDPLFSSDVKRLREITAAVLGSNAPEVTIPAPEGPVTIHRDVADLLTATDGDFALVGEPGAGKSVLAAAMAAELLDAGEDVVFLGAETLGGTLGATRTELAMHYSLDRVLRGWGGSRRATLVVDGVDATRGTGSVDWLPHLARTLADSRWRVLATIRTFDLRYGPRWREMFPGDPIDSSHADPTFARVRHVLVADLTDAELDQVRSQSWRLGSLVAAADLRLLELLRNPFNLRLAAQLLLDDGEGAVAAVRTRQELLHLYWDRRVVPFPESMARRRAIRALTESMVATRRARVVDPSAVVDPAVFGAVEGLLHDGVLREDVQSRRVDAKPLIFSHPVLYDFAVAVNCLGGEDPLHLSSRLDSDPDLAITVRPSLDMHFADLWTDDLTRVSFWSLATALSRQKDGHAIAAVAAACSALREQPTHSDLIPIQQRAILQDDPGHAARMCVAHLAGALEAAEVSVPNREASAPALAELAAALAAHSATTGDLGSADLARVLLFRLDRCLPLSLDSAGVEARRRAIADVMRCALMDPSGPGRESLATKVGEALAQAVAAEPGEFDSVIEGVMAPPVMSVWGGAVISRFLAQLGDLAAVAPELAERIALSVWEFEDPRDEKTAIGHSNIVGLTSTRQQDLEMARFGTGDSFVAFLTAAPEVALHFFLTVVDMKAASTDPSRPDGRLPRVYRGPNLEYSSGHGALNAMAQAVVTFLVSSAPSDDPQIRMVTKRLIKALGQQLTHHQAWNYVLDAGTANSSSVGRLLLEILKDSDLFGHYLTRSSAARLVAALSPILTDSEHLVLEAAILRARDPLDPNGDQTQDLVDSLLGQLDRSHVQEPKVRERLATIDGRGSPPPIPELPTLEAGFRSYGVRERLYETGGLPGPADSLLQAMERLEADVSGTTSGATDDQGLARQRLHVSLPELYWLLKKSDRVIDQAVLDEAFAFLLSAAQSLASDPEVLPGTELGELILELFTVAVAKISSPGAN